MKETEQKRPLASQHFSFHPYVESYDELMGICEATGRKPAEELRDLIDEAISLRRSRDCEAVTTAPAQAQVSGDEIAKLTEVLEQLVQKNSNHTQMIVRLAHHLREQYGLLLETLAGSYGARYLVWKYVAEPMLIEEGLTTEQITLRYEAESKVWNHERDTAADMIEEAIKNLVPAGNKAAGQHTGKS
jgi:hypothetical protein